jgi:hypothetical protein
MRAAIAVLVCLSLANFPAHAAGNQAEKDADKAVRYTEALESNPLRSDAPEMRKWLMQWLAQTTDFEVTVCDILGPIPGTKVPNGPNLLLQQMFGNVAFQIKNPSRSDTVSVQVAGVESLLKSYSVILAKDPGARIPHLDNLLSRQRSGSLKEHMAPLIIRECDDNAA